MGKFFDARLVLTDEQVLLQGRNLAIMLELLSPVVRFGGVGKYLHKEV